MICVIRIRGQVGLRGEIADTMRRMRLGRKYTCVVVNQSPEILGMIKKLKDFTAYGEISDEVFEKLIEKRGQKIDKSKKIDTKKAAEEIKKGKSYEDFNIKPFFRLHPPRGGIESKKHFGVGKGILGDNKEGINKLVKRML